VKLNESIQTKSALYIIIYSILNYLLYIFFCEINVGSLNILPGSERERLTGLGPGAVWARVRQQQIKRGWEGSCREQPSRRLMRMKY
jgi:hypothetical protein